MPDKLKQVVRANVRRLLDLNDDQAGTAKLIKLGFSNGTATRILDKETSIGIDVLEKLAQKLKVEPWQLCVPNLDPERKPALEPLPFRWPFQNIDPEVVINLVGTAAQGVENGLLASLATVGISPRKRKAA